MSQTFRYLVHLEIRSGIDDSVVREEEVAVYAKRRTQAEQTAIKLVEDESVYFDERIQPYVCVVSVDKTE